ncbi:Uncharacterised protein [Segatella copri]|nr:Uncharacterised protein [Segatella copri]
MSCTPPLVDTLFDALFFCEATICSLSLPNCRSVLTPLEGKETLPASTSLMISSSLPSYFSFMFCASKSKVASVL